MPYLDTIDRCYNKPLIIVDRRRSWYRWALDRLGIEYRVKRFFRYLKERTMVFYHKLSARNNIQGIKNLNLFLNLFTSHYITKQSRWKVDEMLIWTLSCLCIKLKNWLLLCLLEHGSESWN